MSFSEYQAAIKAKGLARSQKIMAECERAVNAFPGASQKALKDFISDKGEPFHMTISLPGYIDITECPESVTKITTLLNSQGYKFSKPAKSFSKINLFSDGSAGVSQF